MKRVKLYPEQAQIGTSTLLAESQVERNEPRGNPPAKRDDRLEQNAAYGPAWLCSPPRLRPLLRSRLRCSVAPRPGILGVSRHRLEAQDITLSR